MPPDGEERAAGIAAGRKGFRTKKLNRPTMTYFLTLFQNTMRCLILPSLSAVDLVIVSGSGAHTSGRLAALINQNVR